MGNTASTEASRKPLPSQPPLPPIPPSSFPQPSSLANKLSKPRTRPYSTAGLLKSAEALAKKPGSERHSTPGIAARLVTSTSTPNTPLDSGSSRPLPAVPKPSVTSPEINSSVFTFEEAVAAVNGNKDPAYWQTVSSVYQAAGLDQELLEEQQIRQKEFEQRQWQSQFQFQPQDPQEQKKPKFPGHRRSLLFRSRSINRASNPNAEPPFRRNSVDSAFFNGESNSWDNNPMTYDDIQNQYYGMAMSENWPRTVGSRVSWTPAVSPYEVNADPMLAEQMLAEQMAEQASVTSDKVSVLSDGTWKSANPVRPENPALHRASSDLSLYAPVRRRSIMQVPGVATRRNSSSSIMVAGERDSRPLFRHSHPPKQEEPSFEAAANRILSMPPPPKPRSEDDTGAPMPRTLTPCEGDYKAIGAFKTGFTSHHEWSCQSFIAGNQEDAGMSFLETQMAIQDWVFNFAARTQALAALTANSEENTNTVQGAESKSQVKLDKQLSAEKAASPKVAQTQLLPSPIADGFKSKPRQPTSNDGPNKAHANEDSAIDLPQIDLPHDVFSGFEFSTFSLGDAAPPPAPRKNSPILQVASKTTAEQDHLFDDDNNDDYRASEVLDVRVDPSAKSAAGRPVPTVISSLRSSRSIQSVARSDSGFISSPTSETSHKPLSKADSGYSSNVSLRSFKHAASKLIPVKSLTASEKTDSPCRDSFYLDELKLPSPTFDATDLDLFAASRRSSQAKEGSALPSTRHMPSPPPPVPPIPASIAVDMQPSSPLTSPTTKEKTPKTGNGGRRSNISTNLFRKRHTMALPLDRIELPAANDGAPSNEHSPFPGTPVSTKSDGLALDPSKRASRLFRMLNIGNTAVASGKDAAAAEPSINSKVDVRNEAPPTTRFEISETVLHEQTGLSPVSSKLQALKPQMSGDTLKTIVSVGSLEFAQSGSETHIAAAFNPSPVSPVAEEQPQAKPVPRPRPAASTSSSSLAAKKVTHRRSFLGRKFADMTDNKESQKQGENTLRRAEGKHGSRKFLQSSRFLRRDSAAPATDTNIVDNLDDPPYIVMSTEQETAQSSSSPSSQFMGRAMSLTAQLERRLSKRLSFSRLTRPSMDDDASIDIGDPFEFGKIGTALSIDVPTTSPGVPSPIFAEMTQQQPRPTAAPASVRASATAPVLTSAARMQQARPTPVRIQPPQRSQSTPPVEDGSSQSSSQESFQTASSHQRRGSTSNSTVAVDDHPHPTTMESPVLVPSDRIESSSRHGSMLSRRGSMSINGDQSRSNSMVSVRSHASLGYRGASGPPVMPGGERSAASSLRHRVSNDDYSTGTHQVGWVGYDGTVPNPYSPPPVSNGYTSDAWTNSRRRSGSANSFQQQQQMAYDYYCQQYSRPPPAHMYRGYHYRGRSTGNGSQAPYRVLHSYNSPAYRGVPIWG